MPELPEVEATRRALAPIITGRRIIAVEVARARMLRRQPSIGDFLMRMDGATIGGVGRHGKFLLTELSGDTTWVTHLGMSGRMSIVRGDEPREPHTNVVVALDDGMSVRMVDPRTFGFVAALSEDEMDASSLAALGPDALTALPTGRALSTMLSGRRAPIKALLLDQRLLAGLGNIYADEALHRAGVSPLRPAGSIDPTGLRRLRSAIRKTLDAALADGGTSLDDLAYLLPDGRAGAFTKRLRVYGRAGEPCPRCGAAIRRDVIRGRSSSWCPGCQH